MRQSIKPVPAQIPAAGRLTVGRRLQREGIVFGVLVGVPDLDLLHVMVARRILPVVRLDLVDGTWLAMIPSTVAPAGSMVEVLIQTRAPLDDVVEFLIWEDPDPGWQRLPIGRA